jgi:hypothetical protein
MYYVGYIGARDVIITPPDWIGGVKIHIIPRVINLVNNFSELYNNVVMSI